MKYFPLCLVHIRKSSPTRHGFTLVEVLFALSVMAMIGLAVGQLGRSVFVYSSISQNDLAVEQEARTAFTMMTPEIRSLAPSNTGAYPIATAGTSTFTFYSDVLGDGLRRQVHYYLSGTTLKKGVITPTGTPLAYTDAEVTTEVAHNIVNGTSTAIFDYYGTQFTGTSTPLALPVAISSIRFARVTLLFPQAHGSVATTSLVFTTGVTMRNLKDNL